MKSRNLLNSDAQMELSAWIAQLSAEIASGAAAVTEAEQNLSQLKQAQTRRADLLKYLLRYPELKPRDDNVEVPEVKMQAQQVRGKQLKHGEKPKEGSVPVATCTPNDSKPHATTGDIMHILACAWFPRDQVIVMNAFKQYVSMGFWHGLKELLDVHIKTSNALSDLPQRIFYAALKAGNVEAARLVIEDGRLATKDICKRTLEEALDSKDARIRAATYKIMLLMIQHGVPVGTDLIGRVLDPEMRDAMLKAHDKA